MFRFNTFTRILRDKTDGDGSDLGGDITLGDDNPIFAGADDEWAESSLGFIDDNADLSLLGDSDLKQPPIDDNNTEELDDDEFNDGDTDDHNDDDTAYGKKTDDEENSDSDSDVDDDNSDDDNADDDGDDDDESADDSDDENDDDSDSDDDVDDDDNSDDDSDDADVDNTDTAESRLKAAHTALANYRREAQNAQTALQSVLDRIEAFEADFTKENQKLFDELEVLNTEYQATISAEASDEEKAAAYSKVMAKNREIITLQSSRQGELTAAKTQASEKVQAQLEKAIEQAGIIYPQLNGKSDKKNSVYIRVINHAFQERISQGEPLVKAFVDVVEEYAAQLNIEVADEFKETKVTKNQRDKKKVSKTTQSLKKRVDAAKKTPIRKKNKSQEHKVSVKDLSQLHGEEFRNNSLVKELGIDLSTD